MKNSSTLTSSRPTLMPDRIGIASAGHGMPRSAAKAERRVGARVDADAEPRHAVGAQDAEDRAQQNDHDHAARRLVLQDPEIVDHAERRSAPTGSPGTCPAAAGRSCRFPRSCRTRRPSSSWTGMALVCRYCIRPKIRPMTHTTSPPYMRPARDRAEEEHHLCRSGRLMSASLAHAEPAPTVIIAARTPIDEANANSACS